MEASELWLTFLLGNKSFLFALFWLYWIFVALLGFFVTAWCPVACGILVLQPGPEPTSPALEGQILHHWITKQVHGNKFLNCPYVRWPDIQSGKEAIVWVIEKSFLKEKFFLPTWYLYPSSLLRNCFSLSLSPLEPQLRAGNLVWSQFQLLSSCSHSWFINRDLPQSKPMGHKSIISGNLKRGSSR